MGPVQLLVLGFDHPGSSGEALAEARRLENAGIVRVVDVLAVTRAESGELDAVQVDGQSSGQVTRGLLELERGRGGMPASREVDRWSLADSVPPGGVAVVVLLEHLWAENLVGAIAREGGRPLDELWLGADDRALLEELLAHEA